jgi:hypothetical protein
VKRLALLALLATMLTAEPALAKAKKKTLAAAAPCVSYQPGWWERRLERVGSSQSCRDYFSGVRDILRIQYQWWTRGVVPPSPGVVFDREI